MNSNKFKSVRSKPQSFGGSVTSVVEMELELESIQFRFLLYLIFKQNFMWHLYFIAINLV